MTRLLVAVTVSVLVCSTVLTWLGASLWQHVDAGLIQGAGWYLLARQRRWITP